MQTKRKKVKKISLVFIFFAILSTILSSILSARMTFKTSTFAQSTASVKPPVFPADHAQHPSVKAEWWYINLLTNTTSSSGDIKDLGHIISFSRIIGSNSLLSSRYDDSTKKFNQSTTSGGTLEGILENNLLRVTYTNGSTKMILQETAAGSFNSKKFTLKGSTPQIGTFDLQLREHTAGYTGASKPLLWGCNGIISVFSTNDTAYYSMPNLDVSGTITDTDGVLRSVKAGKAWIDHQWFNSTPPSDWKGHYWLMNQMSTNANMYDKTAPHQSFAYVSQVYSSGNKNTYWVRKKPDGSNQCGSSGTSHVSIYGASGYPSVVSVKLSNTSVFANINMYATSDNQKFTSSNTPSFVETVAKSTGTIDGKSVAGVGIIETHIKK